VVIAGLLAGLLARFVLFMVGTYEFVNVRKDLLAQVRIAVHRLSWEIRHIANQSDILTADSQQLEFQMGDGSLVSYSFAEDALLRGGYSLISGLSQGEFRYQRADGGYLETPVGPDSIPFIWNVEARFNIPHQGQSIPFRILVHPRGF